MGYFFYNLYVGTAKLQFKTLQFKTQFTDLGMFASTRNNLHLRTIHRAKGLEFDAVAIIDLHDGRIPHFSASTSGEINEARRLLYVALTRAKRILMYITDDEDSRIGPSRFLYSGELGLIHRTQ